MNLLNKTSNPAFTNHFLGGTNTSPKTMSVACIFTKSLVSISIIIIISIGIWGVLVTLVWLYIEVLRLMKKLAIRF